METCATVLDLLTGVGNIQSLPLTEASWGRALARPSALDGKGIRGTLP